MTPRLWTWPILLGAASAFGLVAALLADGWWDMLSTAALAMPLLVAARHIARPPRGARGRAEDAPSSSSNHEPRCP